MKRAFRYFINRVILFPYYNMLKLRHFMYDRGFFKSYSFNVPVVALGNLSVGGTGKTPHTEFIVNALKAEKKIAVLSRGYGRKNGGYKEVTLDGTAQDFGDEPLQIKRKFPDIVVVVDSNRVRAIKKILTDYNIDMIILDDALQHRRVRPTKSVLLIDYFNPPYNDLLLPFGRLRDIPERLHSADIVIVTKCPDFISESEMFKWRRDLNLLDRQSIFFSSVSYSSAKSLFEQGDYRYLSSKFAVAISGIAKPKYFHNQLVGSYILQDKLIYRDHYNFKKSDANQINRVAAKHQRALLVTTEKDGQRLADLAQLNESVRTRLFYLPIYVTVLDNQSDNLLSKIIE